jgi:hypothetical protein
VVVRRAGRHRGTDEAFRWHASCIALSQVIGIDRAAEARLASATISAIADWILLFYCNVRGAS